MEGRPFPPVRRLHLDQARPPIWREALDVISSTVAIFFRYPAHLAREVITPSGLQGSPLVRQHAFLARTAKGPVSLIPASYVELAGDVQHLLQFLRRRLV